MARPVNADPARTKRTILAAATRLFADRGQGASLRAVARAAGVSLATIHHYFGSKDGLYQACIESMDEAFGGLRTELVEIGMEGGSLDAILEEAVRRTYRFACTHLLAVRLTTRDAIDRGQVHPSRQAGMLIPGLHEGVTLLEQLTSATPEALRLTIRSVSYLIVRYSLTDSREMAMVLGWDPDDYDEAACVEAVEDHLVFAGRAMLQALQGEA